MYRVGFEKLEVFQDTRSLVNRIYLLTDQFPRKEDYTLTKQLRRASVSVLANLAEGTSRKTSKDQSHFTTMSYSSLMEVLSLIIISQDLKHISGSNYIELRKEINMIANKLNSLRKYQMNKK